jgi:hypothetical protein
MTRHYQLNAQDMLEECRKSLEKLRSRQESCAKSIKILHDMAHGLDLPVCETIEYPKVSVNDGNDYCQNPAVDGHILTCGHLMNTVTPNEVCAPNCHHIANFSGDLKNGPEVSRKNFYCDACVNTKLESNIPSSNTLTSTEADEYRTIFQRSEASQRGKHTKYRRCYVAYKKTSIP